MADVYQDQCGAIADELTADENLFTPVCEDFAADSDAGYGEWKPPHPDDVLTPDDGDDGAEPQQADRHDRALSDEEKADLNELGRVMGGTKTPTLLSATGRGDYVDPAASAPPTAAPVVDPNLPATLSQTEPWWKLGWFDWAQRKHRYGAYGAAALAVVVVVAIAAPWGGEDAKTANSQAASPAFSVPTMTQSPTATPPTGTAADPSADAPIPIKSAQSRCTAGSTDPKQAFDNNLDTAWMCVPAYGVPGTVLRVQFENWYVVTGVSIVPGWNRVNPDGSDEWIKHQTVSTVEYQFNDPDETRLTQITNNTRDEVLTPIQPPVLASAMTITITEFATPTGPIADVTNVPGQGGVLASDQPVSGDLKDFAVSSISVIGHRAA